MRWLLGSTTTFTDVIRYISRGEHAFVAVDDLSVRESFVEQLKVGTSDKPFALIDCREASSGLAFNNALVSACNSLATAIGEAGPPNWVTMSGYLLDTMQIFSRRENQGFLVITNIDRVIASQNSFEVEGALRSAMERCDAIAVVLCGSETTITEMGYDDRPFYLSFPIFRFAPGG